MLNTASLRATGRAIKPIVILTGPSLGAKSSTPISEAIARTASSVWCWIKRNCTVRNFFRALFCEKVSRAVAITVIAAMWWHIITIEDNIAGGEAVAADCLYGMPWAIVWCIRATAADFKAQKGGKKCTD